jgi:hypothetical protein
MHTLSKLIQHSETAADLPPVLRSLVTKRQTAWLVGLLGLLCFLPYPAINFGNRSAIQLGNIITAVMCLPILFVSWKGRAFHLYLVLMAPLAIALLKVSMSGEGDATDASKTLVTWAVACMTLLATMYYAPRYSVELLTGIAIATLLHVGMGAWQMYSFSNDEFPFPELYVNSSFLSVQDMVKTIARYIQRPFGIFPEPSAMSSSLAPWVVFWIAYLGGFVELKREAAGWQKALFGLAATGGLLLIIVSRSGQTIVTLVPVLMLAAMWFVRCRATPKNYGVILLASCVVLPLVIWLGANAMSDRLYGKSDVGNSSWEERSTSLVVGFKMVTRGSLATLVFGLGPGMSSPAIYGLERLEAVWSVVLTYLYETGLVGVMAVIWLGSYLGRTWRISRYSFSMVAVGAVWFIGILLTTSYQHLLPIWMALGWLIVWPQVCKTAATRAEPRWEMESQVMPIASQPAVVGPSPALMPWTPQNAAPGAAEGRPLHRSRWSEPS